MKKTVFAALAVTLSLASCSNDEPNNTISVSTESTCLVFPADGNAYTTKGKFSYSQNLTGGIAEFEVSDFVLNNSISSFKTSTNHCQHLTTEKFGCRVFSIFPEDNTTLTGTSTVVSDIKVDFYSSQLVYVSDPTDLPHRFVLRSRKYPVGRFNVGEGKYIVNTVQEVSYYKGTTLTTDVTTPDAAPFRSESIAYSVVLDFGKMKGALIIYDGKFSSSPMEPVKRLIQLNDLDITFENGTYKMSGKDVVPMIPKGETGDQSILVPLEAFTFDNFEFVATGEFLTSCEMNYTVAGRFGGQFTGSNVPD